ncbi:ARM repeat-containing protein [Ascoidea rubescens DSM 1968]|uniref:ARM repeat-containing protein n=1 Tax=Ascoidea rubescens DSM 1968 TaxID=1344418 RepID=A0A1D2VF14_9ASCO|nr:ARM repeat-containing protein [Ascoidea rubescens DSM 1968]ODV60199.1 ARM repeat-containing protein [Ascoidea rubescens DSM 1968]
MYLETEVALSNLLQGLLSTDNAIRSQSETLLNSTWLLPPNLEYLLLYLAQQAASSDNIQLQTFSIVLFRRLATKSPINNSSVSVLIESNFNIISNDSKSKICNILLQSFVNPNISNDLRHKVADSISEVSKIIINNESQWPELISIIFKALHQNDNSSFKDSAFRILSSNPDLIDSSNINEILPLFNSAFQDNDDSIKTSSVTAFASFFKIVPKEKWPLITPLLPNLLNILPSFLSDDKEDSLNTILENLIDLVQLAPKLFKPMFNQLIEFSSLICKNKNFDSNTRLTALELLTTFSESAPKMVKSFPNYCQEIILINLSMLTEICPDDEEAAEWNNNDDIDDPDEEIEYDAARNSIDRVSLSVRGKFLAPILFEFLPQMINSAQWRERQAALMALSAAVEGCADVLITEIPKLLEMILPLMNDPHPRVQYACCNALGQMSTDFATTIQSTSANQILPSLISKLTNESSPRVQAHAAAALVNFSENATKELLEPYLDDLLTNLVTLLQSHHKYVQEQVLTTISVIADAAEKKFIKYYDALTPILINVILNNDFQAENQLIKAKSVECLSLIALAVGKEKFQTHQHQVLQIFETIQDQILNHQVNDDDPVLSYLQQSWSRLCSVVGVEFLPYLNKILPPLLIQAKQGQSLKAIEDVDDDDINDDEDWEILDVHGKKIALHTSALDDKVVAIELLKGYAEVLKEHFSAFARSILKEILFPALDFYLHDGVREAAIEAIPAMLNCIKSQNDPQDLINIWQETTDKLFQSLSEEPVNYLLSEYYRCFATCVSNFGSNCLNDNQFESFVTAVDKTLQTAYSRIKHSRSNDEDDPNAEGYNEDEYDEGYDSDNEDADEDLLDEINSALSSVFKNSKTKFLLYFEKLIPTVLTFLDDSNIFIKNCGICIVADLIEYCGKDSYNFHSVFVNQIGQALDLSNHPSIRQAACYVVGVAAQYGGQNYQSFCLATLQLLFKIIQSEGSKSIENISATENAISALAKILNEYGSTVSNFDLIVENWIQSLPVIEEQDCILTSYSFLVKLINNNHPSIKKNIAAVLESIIQVLINSNITKTKTGKTLIDATKNLLGYISQEEAMSLLSKYPQDLLSQWFS